MGSPGVGDQLRIEAGSRMAGPLGVSDAYLDRVWVPAIGPTRVAVLRSGAFLLEMSQQEAVTVSLTELAAAAGVPPKRVPSSLLALQRVHLLDRASPGVMRVPDGLPLVPPALRDELPPTARTYAEHRARDLATHRPPRPLRTVASDPASRSL